MSTSTISVPHVTGERPGNLLAGIRHRFIQFFEWFGELLLFCGRMGRAALSPP
jgi:hypothetical protein